MAGPAIVNSVTCNITYNVKYKIKYFCKHKILLIIRGSSDKVPT